jgi:hypothetical protein
MSTFVFKLAGAAAILGGLAACDGDGAAGLEALLIVSDEPAGSNCESGGSKIESGTDKDGNKKLDTSEVESTVYSCNGTAGADGPPGAGGAGTDGADGHSALVDVSAEPVGMTCPNGGQRIEVLSSSYVCSGSVGENGTDADNALLGVTDEAAGANCAEGGQKIASGTDDDGDGVLAEAEVEQVEYVCSGADGAGGLDALVKVASEPAGANCANGGIRVDLGVDDDDSALLDVAEIDATRYLCDGDAGQAGLNSLVSVVDEDAGANCAAGGEKISFGLDADRNDVLDASEVTGTRYACDGADGADGVGALVTLTKEMPGATCATGGQRIDSGMDDDADGALAPAEIDATTYVCNGNE